MIGLSLSKLIYKLDVISIKIPAKLLYKCHGYSKFCMERLSMQMSQNFKNRNVEGSLPPDIRAYNEATVAKTLVPMQQSTQKGRAWRSQRWTRTSLLR